MAKEKKTAFRRPRQKWCIVPPGIVWDVREKRLTQMDLYIATVLGTMHRNEGWIPDTAQARIALLAGVTRKTVNASMNRLCERGHLRKIDPGRPDGKLTYQLIFDRGMPGEDDAARHLLTVAGEMAASGRLPENLVNALKTTLTGPGETPAEEGGCNRAVTGSGGVTGRLQGGVTELGDRGCNRSGYTEDDSSFEKSSQSPSGSLDPNAEGRTADGHASPGDGAPRRGPPGQPSAEDVAWWREVRAMLRAEHGEQVFAARIARLRLGAGRVVVSPNRSATDWTLRTLAADLAGNGAADLWCEESGGHGFDPSR